jgi:hypothetical protein
MAPHPTKTKGADAGFYRGRVLNLATLVAAVCISLAAAEFGLRTVGYNPWVNVSYLDVPLMFSPDSELGWRSKPGEYPFSDIPAIRTTIWPGGFRATAPTRTPRPHPILLLGGSFMQGWAVTDSETCGDRLQEAFPSVEVLNLGTGAYGTYQSLLTLERYLAESNAPPSLVIYGFGFFHESRNVAAYEWVKMLSSISQLGAISVPYVSFDSDGNLTRNPPVSYPDWPLKRQLASVALAQDAFAKISSRKRTSAATRATQLLIGEMAGTARAAGADFLVAYFSSSSKQARRDYANFMDSERIWSIDCTRPGHGGLRHTVPGYDHPNALTNADWASCLESAIREKGGV